MGAARTRWWAWAATALASGLGAAHCRPVADPRPAAVSPSAAVAAAPAASAAESIGAEADGVTPRTSPYALRFTAAGKLEALR